MSMTVREALLKIDATAKAAPASRALLERSAAIKRYKKRDHIFFDRDEALALFAVMDILFYPLPGKTEIPQVPTQSFFVKPKTRPTPTPPTIPMAPETMAIKKAPSGFDLICFCYSIIVKYIYYISLYCILSFYKLHPVSYVERLRVRSRYLLIEKRPNTAMTTTMRICW